MTVALISEEWINRHKVSLGVFKVGNEELNGLKIDNGR